MVAVEVLYLTQVVYIPRSYLATTAPDDKSPLAEETTPNDSSKSSKQKRPAMRRSSSLRKGSELDDSSSGEEADNDSSKEVWNRFILIVSAYCVLLGRYIK